MIRAGSTHRVAHAFHAAPARSTSWAAATILFVAVTTLVGGMAGCATAPAEAEAERLDSNTGTTVTLMPRPIELVVERAQGPKTDPFAYLAPFETNRMGAHELYLWIAAPQVEGALGVPQVYCGEQLMQLEPITPDLKDMGLSGPPYKLPAPWSVQWFFKLSGEVLDCFASAPRLRIVTQAEGNPEPDRFNAEMATLGGLGDFVKRVRT